MNMSMNLEKNIYSIIDHASALVFYTDNQARILMFNKKFTKMIGLPLDQISGEDCIKVVYNRFGDSPGKGHMFKAMVDDAIKFKRPNNFESTLFDAEGIEHTVFWNVSPISQEESNELEGVLFLGNDITVTKERESYFKNIDDTIKNIFLSIKEYALYAINLEGNITYYGMGSESMFGWQRNEIIFKHINSIHQYDDIAYKLPSILEQVKKNGRYELETYFVKKNGQSFPANLVVTKFIGANSEIIGYIFMAKDITERRKLEYQIFQSEKLAAIGQLVTGIAHEINNPVFVISGRTDMLLSDKRLGKKIKNDLKIVGTQINKIRNVVDRLLTFARKTNPSTEELDINKVVEGVLPFLKYHRYTSHEIRIVKILEKQLPRVIGDAHQLQEVFINLFINAYQAMAGGGTLTIKTENLSDRFVQITIDDTGCGIDAEGLRNIFMPFFTTKKEGTGLGLSICYNIIKNHNGTIEVVSKPGCGTTFIIKLPFVKKGGSDDV
jgi:PAS domain S-box-containing protein